MFGIARIQRNLLFPRHMVAVPARPVAVPGLERSWLDTDAGKVELWFLPGRGVSPERPGPAVIFAHGNGELIDYWPEQLAPYRELGVSVVLPEYRGYGRSAGKPSETALAADFRAVYTRLLADARVDPTRILYHGRSLGGGVVCGLARSHAPAGMILESTFTSVVDVARGMGVPAFVISDRFENLPAVRAYQGPLLIMHGIQDNLIPKHHAERLAAAHQNAKLVLYRAGHNDLPPANSDYWQQIASLVPRP
ncbi:MAG: alpha/beta hydrolase [Myxococcales bacterium]